MSSIDLPAPVRRYLEADAADDEGALAQAFAAGATVHDEGRTHAGIEAITAWRRASRLAYRYAIEPLASRRHGDDVVLDARVSGDFPGSPVELGYRFVLREDRILSLEIG